MENIDKSPEEKDYNPKPDITDPDIGKSMWIVEDYKIWAETYEQAVRILPLIKSY
jgi:hypothetical protein